MINISAFNKAIIENKIYDPVFFKKEEARLYDFVSYYESVKEYHQRLEKKP